MPIRGPDCLPFDSIGEPERVAYGPADIERLDIYRSEHDAAPVFVFIHGGAWRSSRSKDFAASPPARIM
jgi:arylformamidase